MTAVLTEHLLAWLLVFMAGIMVASCFGVNPLIKSDAACERAVAGNPAKKVISYAALIVAIVGEYAFFIGAIIVGVRYFAS